MISLSLRCRLWLSILSLCVSQLSRQISFQLSIATLAICCSLMFCSFCISMSRLFSRSIPQHLLLRYSVCLLDTSRDSFREQERVSFVAFSLATSSAYWFSLTCASETVCESLLFSVLIADISSILWSYFCFSFPNSPCRNYICAFLRLFSSLIRYFSLERSSIASWAVPNLAEQSLSILSQQTSLASGLLFAQSPLILPQLSRMQCRSPRECSIELYNISVSPRCLTSFALLTPRHSSVIIFSINISWLTVEFRKWWC